jgi:hypothetical protein
MGDNGPVPLRPINDIARTEEWPSGGRKGRKVSRRTIWTWVEQGLLEVHRDEADGRRTALVDLDEVRALLLHRRPRRVDGPAAGDAQAHGGG